MSRASLWTALPVVYDIAVWFCSGKCSKFRSSSYDCSSSSMLWSSLLLYAILSGVFGIVNSPSSVTVGSSLSLVVQPISIPLELISWRNGQRKEKDVGGDVA